MGSAKIDTLAYAVADLRAVREVDSAWEDGEGAMTEDLARCRAAGLVAKTNQYEWYNWTAEGRRVRDYVRGCEDRITIRDAAQAGPSKSSGETG